MRTEPSTDGSVKLVSRRWPCWGGVYRAPTDDGSHSYDDRAAIIQPGNPTQIERLALRFDTKGCVEDLDSAGCSGCIEMYAGGQVRVRRTSWDPAVDGAIVKVVLSAEAADVVSASSGVAMVGSGAGAGMGRAHDRG